MPLGVASDIHGNRPALQAVVAELEREHLLAGALGLEVAA